jgi:hypothetical protein
MTADGRAVPPVSWEHASLQQIRDLLRPEESEEDIYRVVDELGEWGTELEAQLTEHQRHWHAISGSGAGQAHEKAAAHSARTREHLATTLEDVRTIQASLDALAAAFGDVRDRIERLYQDYQATHEHMLDWVLVRDDEPNEKTRRDITKWARSLMGQYETTANEELRTWPAAQQATVDAVVTGTGRPSPVVPRDAARFPGDERTTRPIRSADGQAQSPPSGLGTAFPGSSFPGDEEAVRLNRFPVDDQLFGADGRACPPVIGEDGGYQNGEDDPR